MLLKTQLNLTEFELFQFYGSNFIKIIETGALSREAGAAQAGEPQCSSGGILCLADFSFKSELNFG